MSTAAINTPQSKRLFEDGRHVAKSVTIQRPASDLYGTWRELPDLARFLHRIVSIRELDGGTSRWTAVDKRGNTHSWDAQIIRDDPNYRISWKTLEQSTHPNAGSVTFKELPFNRGCEVRVTIEYLPPGVFAETFFGSERDMAEAVQESLWRFRSVMEAGEVPTITDQPRGKGEDKIGVAPESSDDRDVRDISRAGTGGAA